MEDTTKLLRMVRVTLNDIEVKGKENLDKLLGCINALESVELLAGSREERGETDG